MFAYRFGGKFFCAILFLMDAKLHKFYQKLFGEIKRFRSAKCEDAICVAFARHLRSKTQAGLFNAVWFHVANEYAGRKRMAFGGKLKDMGKLSGVADYIFMWDGGCGAIEFKYGKGRQSENQKNFQKWCELNNIEYRIAYSCEEGLKILRDWGL